MLRHIYFRKAFATGQVMACAVINGKSIPNQELLVSLLHQAFPKLKSVAVNINLKTLMLSSVIKQISSGVMIR